VQFLSLSHGHAAYRPGSCMIPAVLARYFIKKWQRGWALEAVLALISSLVSKGGHVGRLHGIHEVAWNVLFPCKSASDSLVQLKRQPARYLPSVSKRLSGSAVAR
jgi:hypothetical protein